MQTPVGGLQGGDANLHSRFALQIRGLQVAALQVGDYANARHTSLLDLSKEGFLF